MSTRNPYTVNNFLLLLHVNNGKIGTCHYRESIPLVMNAEKQTVGPALKPGYEVKIELLGVQREGEQLKQGKAMNERLLLPMILSKAAMHHGIRELNSPLSE